MLFLLYANSLPGTVKSSHVAAFADDTKKSPTDATLLQDDLSNLATWSSSAGLMFNESQVQGTTNYPEAQLCVQHVPHKWGSSCCHQRRKGPWSHHLRQAIMVRAVCKVKQGAGVCET